MDTQITVVYILVWTGEMWNSTPGQVKIWEQKGDRIATRFNHDIDGEMLHVLIFVSYFLLSNVLTFPWGVLKFIMCYK